MRQTLDFNTVTYDTITIVAGDRRWVLRDDVPMEVLVRVFGLQALGERIQERTAKLDPTTATAAEAQAVLESTFTESKAEALTILGAIFRWTDPDVTDEELARLFTYEQQGVIINTFFSHRLGDLSAPSGGTAGAGETMETTPPMPASNDNDNVHQNGQMRSHQASRPATSPARTRRTR